MATQDKKLNEAVKVRKISKDEFKKNYFKSGIGTITINVTNEIETLIEVYDTEIKYEENKNMFIRLVDKSNNPITNEILNIKIVDDLTNNEILNTFNGTDIFGLLNVTGGIRTDEISGRIKIPLKNIHTGSYTVTVDYNGNRLQYMYLPLNNIFYLFYSVYSFRVVPKFFVWV